MRFDLETSDGLRYRIRRIASLGMRTGVVVYASPALIGQIQKDQALEQAVNVSTLPGIVGPALAMPDTHQGYGFPIGGVAAMDVERGVVSPGGVGFDINCGMRLIRTPFEEPEVRASLKKLLDQIFRDVPCGTGAGGSIKIGARDLDEILVHGARWMVKNGYGHARDAELSEARGALEGADPSHVSASAKERGLPQLGSLGSGNHFLEVQHVSEIHDEKAARAYGLRPGQVVVMIHSGSRGLGHQVCTDYVAEMNKAMPRFGIQVPDRQLACGPISSEEGRRYLAAMSAAANFAWANRQAMLHLLRGAFERLFGSDGGRLELVYDVCHNIAKREKYEIEGRRREVLVHRKGATRAFPPGSRDVPADYRDQGQPVFIPGSMGTASWVLAGAPGAVAETFGSVCHGAGRVLSRSAAKLGKDARFEQKKLEERGILVRAGSREGILEELPEAYKDVDEVIEVVHRAGLARKVARLVPMAVVKG